jgi:hypothetical protein
MKYQRLGAIPQIVAIVPVKDDGQLRLVKAVKDYLGLVSETFLYLDIQDEVLLSTAGNHKQEIAVSRSGSLSLPSAVMQHLALTGPALVGLVQRPKSVAVKVVEIEEVASDKVRLVDIESPTKIVRRVEALPQPEVLIPQLQAKNAGLRLRYDVKAYVKNRTSLAAWKTRRLLGCAEIGDESLRQVMIAERLKTQDEDGSWSGNLFSTARNLRELVDLGVDTTLEDIKRAVTWLVNRSESTYNPGMFFANDALVVEQADVMAKRKVQKSGTRPRFRQIKTAEKKKVMSGDDLIYAPCGPRIMWPNGLAMEALLAVGCEENGRVQTALETLTSQDWCECGYQNGAGAGAGRRPLTEKQLMAFEASCIAQYRYGGLRDIHELAQADMAHRTSAMSVAQVPPENVETDEKHYLLGVNNHIQGCEFITTRSLSQVKNPRARRFAEAHLWRFASRQYAEDGSFPSESYGTGFHQAGIFQAVARYDHPVAKVVVLRALPWVVHNQHEDGSWGDGAQKDAETFAVVYALLSLGDFLPANLAKTL